MHSSTLIATLALETSSPPCLQDPPFILQAPTLCLPTPTLLQDHNNGFYRQFHGYFTCVITCKLQNFNMFCLPHCSAILNLFHMELRCLHKRCRPLNLLSSNIKIIIFWVLKPKLWLNYRKVYKLLLMTDIFMLFSTLNSLTERIWLWSPHKSFRGISHLFNKARIMSFEHVCVTLCSIY